jgi:hypothetical protein
VTLFLIAIYGTLCIALGVLIGKGLGRVEEFRDSQRETEILEFVADAAGEKCPTCGRASA